MGGLVWAALMGNSFSDKLDMY